MRATGQGIASLFRQAVVGWNRGRATVHAAGIAYYAILSLAPLLALTVSMAAGVYQGVYQAEEVEWRIVTGVEKRVGEPAAAYVHDVIVNVPNAYSNRWATGVSVLFMIWSGSTVFLQLQDSINEMWEITPRTAAARHSLIAMAAGRALSAAVVVGIGLAVTVALAVSTLLAALPVGQLGELGDLAERFDRILPFVRVWTSPVVYTVLFAVTFKGLPQAHIRWRDVVPGAVLTALLFWLGNSLIIFYLANSAVRSLYGAASSVMVFLIWVYYTAWILLFGAKFTYVFAQTYGRPILPYDFMKRKQDAQDTHLGETREDRNA